VSTTLPAALIPAVDLQAIKARQQATWASGDYTVIGNTLPIVAEMLCEAVDIRAGQNVLDVATGHGSGALAAARRWCDVVGIDYVPTLLERGRERAVAERLSVTFMDSDCEDIPFPDATFDVVLSIFGVMFAPDQEQSAQELLRVCRSGGKIGMANWTPDGFIGEMFKIVGSYLPPPAGLKPPSLWGTRERLQELFGDEITDLRANRRMFTFRYRSIRHLWETFRNFYGPMLKTWEALSANEKIGLEHDVTNLVRSCNRGGSESIVVPSEYLEIVLTRR
jgi:ubiquinone/menaquinone biosynthesis C-methylase UbiE